MQQNIKNKMGAGQFKIHCLELMNKVNESKEPIIITKRGKPVAKLVAYNEEVPSAFGFMKDTLIISENDEDIYSTNEEWSYDEENI